MRIRDLVATLRPDTEYLIIARSPERMVGDVYGSDFDWYTDFDWLLDKEICKKSKVSNDRMVIYINLTERPNENERKTDSNA